MAKNINQTCGLFYNQCLMCFINLKSNNPLIITTEKDLSKKEHNVSIKNWMFYKEILQ